MLDDRKTAILRAVVQEYITTAQPVGSGHVASAPGVNVSSATVRNEMAVLEQLTSRRGCQLRQHADCQGPEPQQIDKQREFDPLRSPL